MQPIYTMAMGRIPRVESLQGTLSTTGPIQSLPKTPPKKGKSLQKIQNIAQVEKQRLNTEHAQAYIPSCLSRRQLGTCMYPASLHHVHGASAPKVDREVLRGLKYITTNKGPLKRWLSIITGRVAEGWICTIADVGSPRMPPAFIHWLGVGKGER